MVVVIGSSNMDLTATVDRLPARGETLLGRRFVQSFGGKGANQAVAAARAGAEVSFLSKVGTDVHGDLIEQRLQSEGLLRPVLLRDADAPTGVAMILVTDAGDNQIVVVPGSNHRLTAADVRHHAGMMADARVLLVQLEIVPDAVEEALLLAKQRGLTTILNPAPACPLSPDLLKLVDMLTPNETEVCTLTGITDPAEAAGVLALQTGGSVVVTCGDQGAWLVRGKKASHVPAFVVAARDSTGAGDAFNGALACALAEGVDLMSALERASAAGALATTSEGAQASMPEKAAIDRLCRSGIRRPRIQ
ncbi:MAG: ribokinase [Nitrospira sp.]|nr:ribokinase [Nitrospira sp.]